MCAFAPWAIAAWQDHSNQIGGTPHASVQLKPYGISATLTPSRIRFRLDTVQTRSQNVNANRSGEDIDLNQAQGQNLLTLKLETGGSWHFMAEHYQSSVADTAFLTRQQYLFNHFPITVAAEANARLRVENLKFAAGRTLAETEAGIFGLRLGANLIHADWSLTSTNPAVLAGAKDKGLLLLPSLGFFGELRPSKHTYLSLQADYFALTLDQLEGQSYSFKGLFEYRPTPALAVGVGVVNSSLDVRIHKRDYSRNFSLEYGEPYLSLSYTFEPLSTTRSYKCPP